MEFIAGLFGKLFASKVGLFGLGILTPLLAALLRRKLPDFISSKVGSKLKEVLALKDPADRALVLAWVKWAEAKLPDAGLGASRKALITSFLSRIFPTSLAGVISDAIEEAVKAMDLELKRAQ